jgi:hypothetical protein
MTGRGLTERWSSGSGRQQWESELLTATVKVFCDTCNNGWMAGVESAAKDVVGPMVQGRPTNLDADAQRVVANWSVLKGLVAVQTSKDEQPIPERHYRRVWAARGAPANTSLVWIGHRQDLANPDHHSRARLFDSHFMPVTDVEWPQPIPAALTTYINEGGVFNGTVFRVGHFFALALQHDWPGLQVRPVPGIKADGAFLQIWPTGPTVRWPPRRHVDDLGGTHKITRFFEMAPPLAPIYEP